LRERWHCGLLTEDRGGVAHPEELVGGRFSSESQEIFAEIVVG
jgi:hypothetical protein